MAISLSQLTRANQPKPPRITIHGVAGVGKTTFAAQAYKPVFIQTEDGLGTLSANHFPLARTFEEVLDALAALYTEEHDFKTVVIDSVDWLEPLIWGKACRDNGCPTKDAIYAAYEKDSGDGFRAHLGASIIGKECERALWYDFRWVTQTKHRGRLLRLFETGQLEEARLVSNLRATGATVLEVDPETGRQFRVAAHGGHFGGSLDGVALNLIEAPKTWHVLEFKTHSNKSFNDLLSKKVQASKPQHYAQMQIYMHLTGISRAMYLAVNKDNDELYVERLDADRACAENLLSKAQRVIFAATPTSRISEDPSWYQCRLCDHAPVCHGQTAPSVNCRTCLHATPVEGAWHCARLKQPIHEREQRAGCSLHLFVPDLVPAQQVDAGEDWVEYLLPSGERWRDQGFVKRMENVSCL